jgi:hypothetical protein
LHHSHCNSKENGNMPGASYMSMSEPLPFAAHAIMVNSCRSRSGEHMPTSTMFVGVGKGSF